MHSEQQAWLEKTVLASFTGEIDALKPGNVSRYADGHGMQYQNFMQSAEITTPILCNSEYSVAQRILQSVIATQAAVGCNTNLGMLLLFAPLIRAYEGTEHVDLLQQQLKSTLVALQQKAAQDIFAAIRLAKPAGLGQVAKYDVHFIPEVDVLVAMQAAADHDLIASEYVTGFTIISTIGLDCLREFSLRWNSVKWATVACYLTIMASFPDSHIWRKHGKETAEQTRMRTVPIMMQFKKNKRPASAVSMLLDYDKELKDSNINPGTCADLTAASLLYYYLSAGSYL
ncbi:MAG: triphosphoribosyl-dephospho-CoA synthase [Gammaproteobacteria bacterium]|nr:triphosphoribosyl-dephospho-CoA synthase [Gammaproteobacteria bacterium]